MKWLALLGLAFLIIGCADPQPEVLKFTGPTMGSRYNVSVVADWDDARARVVKDGIEQALAGISDRMSTYDRDSELSRFNRYRGSEPFTVSQQTAHVVREAIRIGELSGGALDVTVGPLVNLWGFGPEGRPEKVPSASRIAQTMQRTGLEHLTLDGVQLIKGIPELYLDLSSIAKGYGADVVAEWLDSQGYTDYLVEVGGEMRLKGQKPDGSRWKIAIEKPVSYERTLQRVLAPGDKSVATSGDYRNYFEQDGKRYSHTIDPDTGKPIEHHLVSATVVTDSCMTADGWATALMVLGPARALATAEQQGLAVLLISKTPEGFVESYTDAFKPYLLDGESP